MKTHPWIDRLVLSQSWIFEDGQIDSACITMNSQIFATPTEQANILSKIDVESWFNQLARSPSDDTPTQLDR